MTREEALRRAGGPLSYADMSAISGLPEQYLRDLVKHGQMKLELVASDKPHQKPIHPDPAEAKRLMREHNKHNPHGGYQPDFEIIPARQVFTEWWNHHPAGRRRIMSTGHRREMENLRRGYPANYTGPLGGVILTDNQIADIDHSEQGGKPFREAVLEATPAGQKKLEAEAKAKQAGAPA